MEKIDTIGENMMIWDVEFDKIKDEDNIDAITADSWFLSDTALLARVVHLFDFSEPKPLLLPAPELSKAKKADKGAVREQGNSRNVRSCNNGTECKSKDEGQKGKPGTIASNTLKKSKKEEKRSVKQVLQIPYVERVEMAKRKLQEGYNRCKDSRKTTCLISSTDIPKPPCRVLPKTKKVGSYPQC